MTAAPSIALHTDDRRLIAAVASFSEQVGEGFVEVGLDGPPTPTPALAVLDLRGEGAARVRPWVAAGARTLVVVDDVAVARDAMDLGAADFALAQAQDGELAVRLSAAWASARSRERGAALRRLVRHDVRGPLAVILGQCEILSLGLGGPLTDKQKKSVGAVERKATELKGMLERLADDLAAAFGWEGHNPPERTPPR